MSLPDSSLPPRPLLRRADQLAIAAVALLALVGIGGYWYTQAVLRGRLIDIDRAGPPHVAYQIDINSAAGEARTGPIAGRWEKRRPSISSNGELRMARSARWTTSAVSPGSGRNGSNRGGPICGPARSQRSRTIRSSSLEIDPHACGRGKQHPAWHTAVGDRGDDETATPGQVKRPEISMRIIAFLLCQSRA